MPWNDPVLNLVVPNDVSYNYAEERRLFYVALTRTRNRVFIVTPERRPSDFIKELLVFMTNDRRGGELSIQKCDWCKDGYLIEDGKLTQPIKDINIIGNGPKALADITMVGNNYKMDNGTWTCGKDGQSCPVTCGMPSALVSKLTVGGE